MAPFGAPRRSVVILNVVQKVRIVASVLSVVLLAGCAAVFVEESPEWEVITAPPDTVDRIVRLDGPWEVVIGAALTPATFDEVPDPQILSIPPRYARYYGDDGEWVTAGAINFHAVVDGLPPQQELAVHVPLTQGDIRAWVNGVRYLIDPPARAIAAGDRSAWRLADGIVLPVRTDRRGMLDILVSIESRYLPFSGMTRRPFRLGPMDRFIAGAHRQSLIGGLFGGAMFLIAALLLALRLAPRNLVPAMGLSALVAVVALRSIVFGSAAGAFLTVPWMNAAFLARFQGVTIYPVAALILTVLRRMYPAEMRPRLPRLIIGASWIWFVVSLTVPVTRWLDVLLAWTPVALAAMATTVATLVRAVRSRREGAQLSLAAVAVALVAIAAEISQIYQWIGGPVPPAPVAWFGFSLFVGFAALVRVFEFRLSLANLREQADHDGLTGLHNRRFLDARLNEEWGRHLRGAGPLAVLMIDIDNFKRYNDTLGHLAGDDVLQTVARVISQHAQRTSDFAARYGGEEFVLLLPNTDSTGAYHLAEQLRDAVRRQRVPHPETPAGIVTVSIGVAAVSSDDDTSGIDRADAQLLLGAADAALYDAKSSGRDAVRSASIGQAAH